MVSWDEILTLLVQNPLMLEFSVVDILWSTVERVEGDHGQAGDHSLHQGQQFFEGEVEQQGLSHSISCQGEEAAIP